MLVVVGGHSRNIGKTSVVCGIIRGLRDRRWAAIKITQHGHGICSHAGQPCECADPIHPVAISEERGDAPSSDSGRFLVAGAEKAFWVRTAGGGLNRAMPRLRRILADHANVIIESNSILQFVKPNFCAMVLDGSVTDFKPTSLRFLDRADALVLTSEAAPSWPRVAPGLLRGRPGFMARAPLYESSSLIRLIERTGLKNPTSAADHTPG